MNILLLIPAGLRTGLFSAILLFVHGIVVGQSVSYSVLENDPDARAVFISINPFNAQYYSPDINIGVDLSAMVRIGDRLQAGADLRKAYLDSKTTGDFVPTGLSKASQFSAGVSFLLASSLKERSNKVVLSSGSAGRNRTSTTYIEVDALTRRSWAVRGGIQRFHNNMQIGNDITEEFTEHDIRAMDKEGHVFYLRDTILFEPINYITNSMGVYAGISLQTFRHLVIDSDYGRKSNRKMDDFYLDLLYCPGVTYELRPNDRQDMYNDLDIDISENKSRHLGWRFGWNLMTNHSAGISWRTEIGQQPGRPDKSFFFSLAFGINFGLKLPGSIE